MLKLAFIDKKLLKELFDVILEFLMIYKEDKELTFVFLTNKIFVILIDIYE